MRVRGRAFAQPMIGIGESVFYRYPGKGPHHHPQGNVGALGAEGVFLGYNRSSNTFAIGDMQGNITAARSVTRRPSQDRWSADNLANSNAHKLTNTNNLANTNAHSSHTLHGPRSVCL